MKHLGESIISVGLAILVVVLLVNLFYTPAGSGPVGAVAGAPAMVPMAQIVPGGKSLTAAPGGATAYVGPAIQLAEAHWHGMETIPLSTEIKKKLRLPMELQGVLIDEATMRAAGSGFLAGDVLLEVNGRRVTNLYELLAESKKVQNQKKVATLVYRNGATLPVTLAVKRQLGFAQVETAPMILAGDLPPHPYRGPCTQCHAIGNTGHMVPDPDGIVLPPPPIRTNAVSPHRKRGECRACHQMLP